MKHIGLNRITHQIQNDKGGSIDFTSGEKFNVSKGKNGHLIVVGRLPQTSILLREQLNSNICNLLSHVTNYYGDDFSTLGHSSKFVMLAKLASEFGAH